jgi:hypothetical protein
MMLNKFTHLIKWVFFPEWEIKEIFESEYETQNTLQYQGKIIYEYPIKIEYYICEVQYSPIRNKWRVVESGYIPNNPKASLAWKSSIKYINNQKNITN